MDVNLNSEIVYDDEEIRVIWQPGVSDFILITFGDLVSPVKDHSFFADTPVRKSNIAAVGIMAKRGNWYPKSNLLAAKDAIDEKVRHYAHRIAYGGSMGGYAAIKFSKLLNVTHVAALCPQWSIDASECDGINPAFQEHFLGHMRGMGIRKEEVEGQIFLFSDPFDPLDMFHCRKILGVCPEAEVIKVPLVGHHVTSALAGTSNLNELIEAIRCYDLTTIRSVVRRSRKNHWHRKHRIIGEALTRFPEKGMRLFVEMAMVDGVILDENKKIFPAALEFLARDRGKFETIEFYETFRDFFDGPSNQLRICSYLAKAISSEVVLTTNHGTIVSYDDEKNMCYHAEKFISKFDTHVKIEVFGSSAALFVTVNNTKFYLSSDKYGNIVVPSAEHDLMSPFQFRISSWSNGRFTLKSLEKFVCAEPSGKLIADKTKADEWEAFRFNVRTDD